MEASDGEEAMKKFYENKDILDLLILDVILPKMNGKQIYEKAVTVRPDIKALFISGYMKDIVISKGLESDIEILQKPFSSCELLSKVRQMLD
ncbi:MAG TPA: response regulator [Syntrophorhabdaceae bacterium]|nr:response regulator [Syntrophorhabdaceae bacterium]